MKSTVFDRVFIKNSEWRMFSPSLLFPLISIMIALLIGGMLGLFGSYAMAVVLGTLMMTIIIFLRQDELAAMIVIAVHLYVDWYLAFRVVALMIVFTLLIVFFLTRSTRYPWAEPRHLWLWFLFLAITIIPSINGATTRYDALFYYPNVIVSAFVMYWLGTILGQSVISVRRLFQLLTVLAVALAIHTLIEAITGKVLFATSHYDAFLTGVSNYQLSGSYTHRAESFFIDPNWNGTFLAMMVFIPFGLFVASPSLLKKALNFGAICFILPALLFTYSNGAWIGAFAGIIAFIFFVGRMRYRILIPLLIIFVAAVIMFYFPLQLSLQLQHASNPEEIGLRVGAWQTALRVIQAFPWTGIGLGLYTYLARAEPYRVPAQYVPLAHPHNSYLEIAAMAGLPVLLLFVALLLSSLWLAMRNWRLVEVQNRSLLGGGIASIVALSVNSMSINGWTLPPICAIGWMILGVLSSPLLMKNLQGKKV
jgi:O-antigen ligase